MVRATVAPRSGGCCSHCRPHGQGADPLRLRLRDWRARRRARAQGPYRAPFANARSFMVSQAPPDNYTHSDPSSRYAIDFAMPEGSAVHAAREEW